MGVKVEVRVGVRVRLGVGVRVGVRVILSDYRTLGLTNPRIIGPSDLRYITEVILLLELIHVSVRAKT